MSDGFSNVVNQIDPNTGLFKGIVSSGNASSSNTPIYYTDWIVLPGTYFLPCTGFTNNTNYYQHVLLQFNCITPNSINTVRDNFSGGTFYGGTFYGKWYNPSIWKGGIWSNAYNAIDNDNLQPQLVPNQSTGNKTTYYNDNLEQLIISNRYLETPPWVNVNQNEQNVVGLPIKKL